MISLDKPTLEEMSLLQQEIRRDSLATDFKFSLFVGALNNFKYESLLKPIPIQFKNSDGEVDIDRLRQLTARLPGFLKFSAVDELTPEEACLLKNVLLNNNQYQLSSIPLSDLKEQVLTSDKLSLQTAPQWIFKIEYNSTRNQVWDKWRQSASTFYAFHGSRFENFHSILNLGLHQHLNKTSLFGEGIYLSTEHSLSLQYSPCGEGWMKSQLGCELSVVALCEVINHPDVKRQGTTSGRDSVPEKYILVTNNELVRPRFLLVYTRPKSKTKLMAISFWQKHKFAIFLAVYVFLLIGIGFAKKVIV